MKNEDLQEMRKEYIQDITLEVSKWLQIIKTIFRRSQKHL